MSYIINQDIAESVISTSLNIYEEIISYGGLCGGWSMMLLQNPDSAMSMWEKFERLHNEEKFIPENVTTEMKSFFRSVMYFQYRLDFADAESDVDYGGPERENNINLLADLIKQPHFIKPEKVKAFYDKEDYRITDAGKWDDIKELVDQQPLLVAMGEHFMAITKKRDARNEYYLSETDNVGYLLDKWEKIIIPLKRKIGSENFLYLKYSDWSNFPVKIQMT